MTKLTGEDAYRFLAKYEFLHDAEIQDVVDTGTTLSIGLGRLCLIDPKTNWWSTTDVGAKIVLEGVTDCEISGELIEYSVYQCQLRARDRLNLVSNSGGNISANFVTFSIYVSAG